MHSYTLNNDDGGHSQESVRSIPTQKSKDNHLPIPHQGQDISSLPYVEPLRYAGRVGDAVNDAILVDTRALKHFIDTRSKEQTAVNSPKKFHDTTIRRHERGNKAADNLAVVISQASASDHHSRTILEGRSQNQVKKSRFKPYIAHRTTVPEPASRSGTPGGTRLGVDTGKASSQLLCHRIDSTILSEPVLETGERSIQIQEEKIPTIDARVQRIKSEDIPVGSLEVHRAVNRSSSFAQNGTLDPATEIGLSSSRTAIQSGNVRDIRTIAETFTQCTTFTSNPPTPQDTNSSFTTNIAMKSTMTSSVLPHQERTLLLKQECEEPIIPPPDRSSVPPDEKNLPDPPPPPPPQFGRPVLLLNKLSPPQANSGALPSLFLHHDTFVPIPDDNPDDNYTSADAEGKSIDFDFEPSKLSPDISRTQSIPSSPQPTSSTSHVVILSTKHQRSQGRHASGLVIPPREKPPPRMPRRYLAYVEVPGLPSGKRKSDYQPLDICKTTPNRRKRRHNRYDDNSDSDWKPGGKGQSQKRRKGQVQERGSLRRRTLSQTQSQPVATMSISSTSQPERAPSTPGNVGQEASAEKRWKSTYGCRDPEGSSTVIANQPSVTFVSAPSVTSTSGRERPSAAVKVSEPYQPIPMIPSTEGDQYSSTLPPSRPPVPNLKVRSVQHSPLPIVAFNTRRLLEGRGTEWSRLGSSRTRKCVKPGKPVWDRGVASDDEDNTLSVGEPISWRGCSSGEEEETLSSRMIQAKRENSSTPVKSSAKSIPLNSGPRHEFVHDSFASTSALANPMPTLDLAQVLKSRDAKAKTAKQKRRKKAEAHAGGMSQTVQTVQEVTSNLHPVETETTSPLTITSPLQPHQLSEKARGKQKAAEPDPPHVESSPVPYSTVLITPDHHGTAVYPLASNIGSSRHSFDLHDTLDQDMENYLNFDLSPEKVQGQENGSNGGPSKLPFSVAEFGHLSPSESRIHNDDPFQSQSEFDLFHVSPSLDIPTLDDDDAGTHLYAFRDSFGALSGGEKANQIATINPAFLDGDRSNDDIDDDLQLSSGGVINGTKDDLGLIRDGTRAAKHQLTTASTIGISPSTSRASSRSVESLLLPRSKPSSLSEVLWKTSSPEFPEDRLRDPSDDAHSISSHPRLTNARSRNISMPRRPLGSSSRRFIDTDDEDNVQQTGGLELDYDTPTSDRSFVGTVTSTSDRAPTRTAAPRRTSLKAKRSASTVKTLGPVPQRDKEPRLRNQTWPTGNTESYCHQCRRRTFYLKMTCLCEKKYCSRCISIRYPELRFQSELDDFECPYCRNECNCDLCSRKRGEDYVSFRTSLKHTSTLVPARINGIRTLSPATHELDSSPFPDNVKDITGPFTFWGTIYKKTGGRFASGYAPPGDKVILANILDGHALPTAEEQDNQSDMRIAGDVYVPRRVFIGSYQRSWRLGKFPKETRERGSRRDQEQYPPGSRWYVGKRHVLDRPIAAHTRDLPVSSPFSDLSSLTSLSDDSDIEVDLEPLALPAAILDPSANHPTPITTNNLTNDQNSTGNDDFDPTTIRNDDTTRLLVIALESSGIKVKIGDSLLGL